tara:strand:- start:224 stop:451 length:228 start_codon:yes stop_codon:yes gene_type:complete
MKGKLILTAIILGGGAFFLFSDSFDEYIGSYASAASSDIENLKDISISSDKINETFEVVYEKFISLKLLLDDFFK